MNISVLKSTANVLKAFAVRFFDLYFFIYALLITTIALSGLNYIVPMIICCILLVINSFSKLILNTYKFYRNIGSKYGICVIVLFVTYIILSLLAKNELFKLPLFIFSVLSLFGLYDTNINMISALKKLFQSNETKKVAFVIKECDIETSLCKLSTVYKQVHLDEINDDVFNLLSEFLCVNNENQMGRLLIRSMTACDDNGTEKICIKAKDKYQLIIRGKYENIIKVCDEVVGECELLQLDEKLKHNISKVIEDNNMYARNVCVAFKEVDDISEITDDGYIFAGVGSYKYNTGIDFNTVTDAKNEEKLINAFGETITITSKSLEDTISKLHSENIFVCGKYRNCDGLIPPAENRFKLKISGNFENSVNYIYLMLIAVILFSSDFLLSVFSVDAFSLSEILYSGIIIYIYCTAAVLISKYKPTTNNALYSGCIINSLAVLCVYFIGRYLMINGETSNDLFYKITASSMAVVTLIMCTVFSFITCAEFYNLKCKIMNISLFLIMLIFFLLPLSKVIFNGYCISSIYILTSISASLIAFALQLLITFIWRKKNERKISD